MSSSGSESDSSETEEEIKCSLKIKHRNRVKKINELPDKFAKLNNIIKKKYEDFKEGKPTYTMCYLDEENELINISDEEDYCVFKDHVKSNRLSSAKVFLTNKGEERNFDPLLEANRTICESMIMDEAEAYPKTFRAVPERVLGQSVSDQANQQMLELIRKQLDYLVQKDKQEEIEKAQAKAKKEEAKRAKLEKQEVLKKKKKEKEEKKKLKEEKKKLKEVKKKVKKQEKDGKEKKEKKEGEGKERADSLRFLSEELGKLEEKLEPGVEQIGVIDQDTQNAGEQEKHEFSIQPVLKRKDDKKPEPKNTEVISEPKNVEVKPEPELAEVKPKKEQKEVIEEVKVLEVQAEEDSLCSECKSTLNGKTYYICSICSQYNICEKCEYDSQHQHVFIKLPVGAKFDAREYDEFWQKLLGMFSDNLVEESEIQEAIINQSKNWLPLKIKPMNLKKAQILRKDKYKDGLFVKKGELVEIEWEVKNLTNSDWPNNVTIECLPSSDIFINEQLTNLVLKKGEKSSISVKFYAPKEIIDKEVLDVNLCLFDETKTAIGEELKIKLTILE